MSNYLVTDTELTQTANAIRTKAGSAASIPFVSGTGFKSAIEALPSGGGTTIATSFLLAAMTDFGFSDTIPLIPVTTEFILEAQ